MLSSDKNDHWFLLQFKGNSHNLANRNLLAQGFTTFLPLIIVTSRIGTKFRDELKPLFPGYMFVSVDPSLNLLGKISNTIGVNRLVKTGDTICPLPNNLVNDLKFRSNSFTEQYAKISKGDKIRITHGPFSGLIANIEKIDPEKRIWALFDILGRKSRLEVSSEDFELV